MIRIEDLKKKEQKYLVDDVDRYFRKGYISMLYGDSGLGKTTISLYMIIMLGSKKDLFEGLIQNSKERKCLFLSGELYEEEVYEKLYKLMQYYKINETNVKIIGKEEIYEKSIFDFIDDKYDFIVADSFLIFFNGNIINASEVENFLTKLSILLKKQNSHLLFIHHEAKNLSNQYKNSFLGVSTIKYLTSPFLKVEDKRGKCLIVEKDNFGFPFKKLYYNIDKNGNLIWYIKKPIFHSKADNILNILKRHPEGLKVGELLKKSKLSKNTFYKYLKELEKKKLIQKIGNKRNAYVKLIKWEKVF